MRSALIGLVVAGVVMLCVTARAQEQLPPGRERTRLDQGWRFALGHGADPARDFGFGTGAPWSKAGQAVGAVRPEFDDSGWREVNLPHDWVVELPFVEDTDDDHIYHGSKPVGRRYPETTIGWYRKRFTIPASDEGRRISLEFDGVFRDCHVWLNGHLMARNESGYSGFAFDATDVLNYGEGRENTLVVRADASHFEGWFYEGAGIYRHVWLLKTSPVHMAKGGVIARSILNPDFSRADMRLNYEASNETSSSANVAFRTRLLSPRGGEISQTRNSPVRTPAHGAARAETRTDFPNPELWFPEHPNLYRVVTTVLLDGIPVDEVETTVGFRSAVFDKDRGLLLNGQPLKVQGVCCHQDHAGVGSALPDGLQYFRIARLKEMGVNAYRTSHNPPTPELLDACDRLGVMVLDENRLIGPSEEVLSQLSRLVLRDRNRPCVIAWSIGNEEPEQGTPRGQRIAEAMVRTVHELDPTRPVTYAANNGNRFRGINEVVDLRGFNYFMDGIDAYHKEHPEQPLWGSETASSYWTRGVYEDDPAHGHLSAYDIHKPGYGALAEEWVRWCWARPFVAGGFAWTGFDYRGEPSPFRWPCISSQFGIADTCGFPKNVFYYHKAWWGTEPVLHLFPHWNWAGHEGKPIDVWCFTNCERVQLLLNGRDIGTRDVERLGHVAWKVPYEPGTLEAVGFRGGKESERTKVVTTGEATKLVLTEEPRPEGAPDDVRVVRVSAVDGEGRAVPTASTEAFFSLEGPGRILGVGNGDPISHEADTFIPAVFSRPVGGWRWAPLDSEPTGAPSAIDLDARPFKEFDPGADATQIRQAGASAVFWTRLHIEASDLRAASLGLSFGRIDDRGRVFVNGQPAGESNDWRASPRFDLTGKLHAGDNDLVVIVTNNDGPGGIGRGVLLFGRTEAQQPRRRLFNGLAQVLIAPGPGEITLRATSEDCAPASLVLKPATLQ